MQDRIDIFIPASPKDATKLKFVMEQAAKHIPECGDFHVCVPDKTKFPNYSIPGHKVFLYEDFDVLPLQNALGICRFRPNWIFQQLLKLLQGCTNGDLFFCLDADCMVCRDMNLLSNGKPRLFVSPNGKDEAAFHRFIAKMSGGQLVEWTDEGNCTTHYIADMQLFSRSEIQKMILRYFPSANDFVHFTLDNTYWRRDDTGHAIFISEYEMYGRWIEKNSPDSAVLHRIEKRQIDRNQWSQ